jgi:hypothetical protein
VVVFSIDENKFTFDSGKQFIDFLEQIRISYFASGIVSPIMRLSFWHPLGKRLNKMFGVKSNFKMRMIHSLAILSAQKTD